MGKNQVAKSSIKNNTREKAIAYLRVSTQDQKDKGHSLEAQEKYVREYAEKHNFQLIDIITESKSASKVKFDNTSFENSIYTSLINRPKLLKIISTANQSKFKHLIVSTRDRLARNLEVYVGIKFFLMKKGIEIHFANPSESMNIENKGLQNFIELVFGSIAELEANLISDRVRDGMSQKVRNGYWPGGRTPYGYTIKEIIKNGKTVKVLSPNIIQQFYIEQIFKLHNQFGYSYRKIADILNQENNVSFWNKSKIERIITSETYTGKIAWGRRSRRSYDSNNKTIVYSANNACKQIITVDQWELATKIRNKKLKIKDKKYYNTPFLLRDKLVCGLCGAYLQAKNYGNDRNGNPREGVYKCDCTKNLKNNEKMVFKKSIIENKFIEEYLTNLTPKKISNLWYYYSTTKKRILKETKEKLEIIESELKLKRQNISKLNELIHSETNNIILEALKSQKPILKKEIDILESYKKELESISEDLFLSQSELLEKLKNFFKYEFINLSNQRKRMIIDMLVDKIIVNKPKENPKLTIYMTTNIDIL